MSKYNLQDILNEYVGGGRVGTINISYRDLQDAMDTIERQGDFVVRELSGPSGDGKVNREFEVVYIGNARRKGKEEGGFTVYDYKFGFDPGSEDHFDEEYDFSIGGNNKKIALILARDLLGPAVKGYFGDDQKIVNSYTPQMANDVIMSLDRNMDDEGEMTDYAADIEIDSIDEEEMSKSDKNKLKKVSSQLKKSVKAHDKQSKTIDSVINEADTSKLTDEEKKELKFHLDQFKKGNIDREDIMNVLDQFGLTEMMDKPDYNEEEEEIIKNIERMNPEVKKKFLRKLADLGKGKLDEIGVVQDPAIYEAFLTIIGVLGAGAGAAKTAEYLSNNANKVVDWVADNAPKYLDKVKDYISKKVKLAENADQDNAVYELRNIVDQVEELGDEARQIVRQFFPNEMSRMEGYGVFNLAYSNNRYDTTLGSEVDRLEEGDYDDIDDEDYPMQENKEKEDISKILQAQKIIKKVLKDEGGAAGLKPIVAALKGLKIGKDELIKILKKTVGVVKHQHGDYIIKPIEEVKESRNLSDYNEDIEKVIKRGIKRINIGSSDEEDVLYYVHNNWMENNITAEEAMRKISDYLSPLKEGTCGYDRDVKGKKLDGPGGLGERYTKPGLYRKKLKKAPSADKVASKQRMKLPSGMVSYMDFTEQVLEKLTKKHDVGDFVDDFKKSDAKQFKGKSAKKKKEMAVAAYLAKQNEK